MNEIKVNNSFTRKASCLVRFWEETFSFDGDFLSRIITSLPQGQLALQSFTVSSAYRDDEGWETLLEVKVQEAAQHSSPFVTERSLWSNREQQANVVSLISKPRLGLTVKKRMPAFFTLEQAPCQQRIHKTSTSTIWVPALSYQKMHEFPLPPSSYTSP